GLEQCPGLVVLPPPALVGEDVVGLGDLLEARLGLRIPRVLVRVELTGELAVRLLDLRSRRVLGNAESGVVVLLDHVANTHGAPPLFMILSPSRRRVRIRT